MSTVVFNYIWRFSMTDFPLSSSNLQGHQSTLSCLLISLSGVRLINFIFLAAALYVGVYVRISLLCHCYHRFACRWCRSWSLSTFNSVFSFLHQISRTYDILSWRFDVPCSIVFFFSYQMAQDHHCEAPDFAQAPASRSENDSTKQYTCFITISHE